MPQDLADTLRQAIEDSGLSAYRLGLETGVPQPMITKFLNGKDLRLATASTLAAYLGLELRKAKRKK